MTLKIVDSLLNSWVDGTICLEVVAYALPKKAWYQNKQLINPIQYIKTLRINYNDKGKVSELMCPPSREGDKIFRNTVHWFLSKRDHVESRVRKLPT